MWRRLAPAVQLRGNASDGLVTARGLTALVPSPAHRVEQRPDLAYTGAASTASLTALTDLLQRARATTSLVEDGSARYALTKTNDHRVELRSKADA